MLSPAPITPSAKSFKMPSTSSKKWHCVADNETQDPMDSTEMMSEDGIDSSSSLVSINRQGLEESFRVDCIWHRSQHFALVSVSKGRKAAASLIYLWLVFMVAFDSILQFSLGNSHNA